MSEPEFKTRRMPPFGKVSYYEAWVLDRKGKGFVSLKLSNGQPAQFSEPPISLEEARQAIIDWNKANG